MTYYYNCWQDILLYTGEQNIKQLSKPFDTHINRNDPHFWNGLALVAWPPVWSIPRSHVTVWRHMRILYTPSHSRVYPRCVKWSVLDKSQRSASVSRWWNLHDNELFTITATVIVHARRHKSYNNYKLHFIRIPILPKNVGRSWTYLIIHQRNSFGLL